MIKLHHLQYLYIKLTKNITTTTMNINTKEKMTYSQAIKSIFGRKQIPLCKKHHAAMHRNEISLKDLKKNQKPIQLLSSNKTVIK